MSGFLHRLAARTLGLAPHIRPRAALPYAAPQPDFPGAGLAGEQVAVDPANSETDAAGSPSPAQSHGNTRRRNPLPGSLLVSPPVPRAAATPRVADRTADSAGSELPHAVTSPPHAHPLDFAGIMHPIAFSESQPDEGAGPERSQLPLETPDPIRDTAATRPDVAGKRFGDLDTLVSQLLGQGKHGHQQAPPRPSPDLVPAGIAAPAGAGTIGAQASRERPLNRTPAAAPEAAPEVHITIGRLEVNPPSRPAPPPAPAARGPAPLSLSDYLARRNGGRS